MWTRWVVGGQSEWASRGPGHSLGLQLVHTTDAQAAPTRMGTVAILPSHRELLSTYAVAPAAQGRDGAALSATKNQVTGSNPVS